MSEHLSVRCLNYQLLLPGGCIQSIRALSESDFFRPTPKMRTRAERMICPRLDLRCLLAPGFTPPLAPCAGVHWIAESGSHNAFLVVDSVERIIHIREQELRPLPAMPKRLTGLCDGILFLPDGRILPRLHPEACWPMSSRSEKREFLQSLIRLRVEANEGLPS